MKYKSQLRQGQKVESEHRDVMAKMRKYLKTHKRLPPNKEVYKWVAQTHLKEDRKYYSKLKKAKL